MDFTFLVSIKTIIKDPAQKQWKNTFGGIRSVPVESIVHNIVIKSLNRHQVRKLVFRSEIEGQC